MSGFTALNVEPEDDIEQEVDDTKEIQLEEAFKLYQNALKLQSQGPASFPEAFEAYRLLFQSEIFRYPEVISDFRHDQLDDADTEAIAEQPDVQTLSALPANASESSANSLPQLIHLAYKNRGQFVLEVERYKIQHHEPERLNPLWYLTKACRKTLGDYGEALERDDTDIDLWKKAARVAEIFSSQRIVRFCLESVLAGDDDAGQAIDLSGLDEAYAAGELNEVASLIDDDLSTLQLVDVKPKENLLRLLKQRNDPYCYLPSRPKAFGYTDDRLRPIGFYPRRYEIKPASRSWLSLAQTILQGLIDEQSSIIDFGPGGAISIEFPDPQELEIQSANISRTGIRLKPTQSTIPASVEANSAQNTTFNEAIVESPCKTDLSPEKEGFSETQRLDDSQPEPVGVTQSQDPGVEQANNPQAEADNAENPHQSTVSLPTRKRSSTVAGNEEPTEVRSKSKRLRARESMAEAGTVDEEVVPNLSQYYQDQLEDCSIADRFMLNTINSIFTKLGIEDLGSLDDLKHESDPENEINDPETAVLSPENGTALLLADLRQALMSWSDSKSHAILQGHGNPDFLSSKGGLTLFLQHSKTAPLAALDDVVLDSDDGLIALASQVNTQWSNIHDVNYALLESLLCSRDSDSGKVASSYLKEKWSSALKETVVQLIVQDDEFLYRYFDQSETKLSQTSSTMLELIQTIFELHLDIYCEITNPQSQVASATRLQQRDRLARWASLASVMFNSSLESLEAGLNPETLVWRFLWASTIYGTKHEDANQDHILLCLQDLRLLLDRAAGPPLSLPNNLAMPEISAAAVDQEMSRLSTLDFFMSVFDSDQGDDAVDIIEKLEPILEMTLFRESSAENSHHSLNEAGFPETNKLVAFLESGDASLKLYLWKRLQNAYQSISYRTKVVSCQLRAVETIANEIETQRHRRMSPDEREISLLKWLRDSDELVNKLLPNIMAESNPFESIDLDHLRSSMIATARLSRVLHGFALYEDMIRVGKVSTQSLKSASSTKLFERSKDRFKEMQVRNWTLQYLLLKEATIQCPEKFPAAADDLADYLRSVHIALGIRQYCKFSNKIFLKMAKTELLATQSEEDYSADVAQVLYDLHGLKFAPGIGDYDHGCPPEPLDKKTAMQLVPVVMIQAYRINIRDFQKSDLKVTIDRMHQSLGVPKSSTLISNNKRAISSFLKSAINPKDLYNCIKGIGDLTTKVVHGDSAEIARHGWYFLLGHIALAKFKGVKRVNPTATDELDIAAGFFRNDLEHGTEKWETWYRLAQVYEAKIEDDLMWNSTKLNEHRQEIATLERNAIHAFSISVAIALRSADDHPDTQQKISEMFTEFAVRLYSSSREPLGMEAFRTDKQIRHLSDRVNQTMYKSPAFNAMRPYAVWKLAAYLLRMGHVSNPKQWMSHYTLGKCLWKMFCNPERESDKGRVTAEHVLEAFVDSIEALPPKKDKGNEYILEPHFKLVSTVHKMVQRNIITPDQGVSYLQSTSYARKIRLADDDQGPDWDRYILEVLKKLGTADKSNWHHRIIARAAHVIYDENPNVHGALGAKHEFTQQIFTKTMTLQVWKPEHERAGRHYVYTGRYVRFFVSLLNTLNDRPSLDQLIRRIRRRPTDFLDHNKIWEEIVIIYVRLLRRIGKIPESHDRTVFESVSHEDFVSRSDKLEKWGHDPENSATVLDILRDTIELKKLNNSLMKGTMIDDLIVDTYATMYETFVSELPPEDKLPPQLLPQLPVPEVTFVTMKSLEQGMPVGDGRMSVGNLLTQSDGQLGLRPFPSLPVGLGLQHSPIVIGTPPSYIEPPRIPTPVKPGRVKQVTKVELRRRAENLLLKPPPIKTPVMSKKPVIDFASPSRDRGGSVSVNLEAEIDGQEMRMGRRLEEIRDEEGAFGSRGSSRRGSIHDSADDESELSEVEGEDETEKEASPRQMFPGLMSRIGSSWNRMKVGGEDGEGESEGQEDEEADDQENDKMEVDAEVEIQDSQDADNTQHGDPMD